MNQILYQITSHDNLLMTINEERIGLEHRIKVIRRISNNFDENLNEVVEDLENLKTQIRRLQESNDQMLTKRS